MTDNFKNYKDQINEAINNELTFVTCNFNLSSGTSKPLPVVNVSLRRGNKYRATTVAGLICLWGIRANDIMIKIRHTKHYERKMRYNKVEYNTAAGVYCTTHYAKVPYFMP